MLRVVFSAILCFHLFASPFIDVALAQNRGTVIDPASNGTSKGSSNGVDVINIAAPSASGVSHNKFTDYNVNEKGQILNNSNFQTYDMDRRSQLSGEHVEYNRNFGATGERARVILNEVTGNNTSELRGTVEIYGKQADLVIANPNGITCAGCSFLNTSKLSLITGTPNMVNGDIKDFSISNVGIIRIEGVGEQRFAMEMGNSAALI
ncbi:MAG: filamentous hemagglutinin N-terminal domain-containing protein, partial [Deferribacteraceae bacterium]|nr:filamentous hemagglutinin N-terminal domain-containing protein [Deferribacteraceae bacterium]